MTHIIVSFNTLNLLLRKLSMWFHDIFPFAVRIDQKYEALYPLS